MVEDGPVVDPFAERVGIKDAAEKENGSFGWVPVLDGVTGGEACSSGVFLCGLYW